MTTAIATTNAVRRISAAGKNFHDADAEVRRIKAALHETDTQLLELDHDTHVATLTAAVDAAITSQDAHAINDAARALQEGRNQTDAPGTARMVAQGRQRTLQAALVHAQIAAATAQREVWREREARLCAALDREFAEYEALLEKMVTAHLRVSHLANEVWGMRAAIVGVPQVNIVSPQAFFQLPIPNGSLPNLPPNARTDLRLQRSVALSAPPRLAGMAVEWAPADRALVEAARQFVAEV
jgi:hypothetical protein